MGLHPHQKAAFIGMSPAQSIYIINLLTISSTQHHSSVFKIKNSPFLIYPSKAKMISSRKLVKMARKWQRLAALGRKRITSPRKNEEASTTYNRSSSMAEKGHFIVYTADKKRYAFPIAYLNNYILRELLIMSEEEFGLRSDGPITLPCDAIFLDYAISLIQNKATKDVEKALLISMSKVYLRTFLLDNLMVL
ncbi:unnamed protein product [Fraxinus pennsylvanica]|uniref:Small auxin up regulated protein n=1 Tax=Fraxinus pennsylvanica TaxID=56036 RepID=A0AAD1ZHP6_9LAMI|nr:unnamed protein product [Fraxinus pennsylvanica]